MRLRNKLKSEKGLGLISLIILAVIVILVIVIVIGGTKSVKKFINDRKAQEPDILTQFQNM